MLHENPARNSEVVDRWVSLLQPYNAQLDRMLAPNAAEGFSQCVYHKLAKVNVTDNRLEVDLQAVEQIAAPGLLDTFYVKTTGPAEIAGPNIELMEEKRDPANNRLLRLRRRG